MAYPRGHDHFPRQTTERDEDSYEVPPDYDAETLPHPRHQNNDREVGHDNGVPPGHYLPNNVNGYPRHQRSSSGEFDNRVFDFPSTVYQNGASPVMDDRRRGYDPDPYTTEIPPGFDHLDAAENGRNHHQTTDLAGRYNPGFSQDETLDRNPTLRRRYKRSRQSSRRRNRDGDEDNDSLNLSPEDMQRTKDLLATIRIRRRVRKSLKRSTSHGDGGEDAADGEDYEELTGLPSALAVSKVKPLSQRLLEMHGTADVAQSLRETYTDFDPSLVAGAAWRGWEKRKAQLADFCKQLDVWTSHFKEIEGRFGSATASYFRFTRWLVFLNLTTILTTILVIVIPFISSDEPSQFGQGWTPQANISVEQDFLAQAVQCSSTYRQTLRNFTEKEIVQDQVLDFFVGTGWMEKTVMFYGHYRNRTFTTDGTDFNYNMGLAYFLSLGITFLISFVLILVNSSYSIKETVMDDQEQSSIHFTNSVLCGWDYCIFDEKTAKSKKSILFQEFKADLEEQSKRLQRQNRTNGQKLALFVVRVAINFVVLSILAGTSYLIYFTTDQLLELKADDEVVQLIIQFLPSMTITFLNFVIPEIFTILVAFEDYWPAFALKITLMRCVFVRMSSVLVLSITLYYKVLRNSTPFHCPEEGKVNITTCCGNARWRHTKNSVECWETYVGQQIYKLVLVDFFAIFLITVCIEFPRKWFFDHFKDKSALVNEFGKQEFDIPKHVLEIVYYQSLSWLGTYFAPLLPAMTLIKFVLIFYLKKLSLMKNHAPPQQTYRVSKSNSFFNIILLIFFVLVVAIVGYMVGNINPSQSCGPFRQYSTEDYLTWTALTDVVVGWPEWASKIFFFFGTSAFFVPCFIVLCLLIYYYWAVGQGYKRMEEILRDQLKLEGKDKQFLLARVNDIIKHGNLQGVTTGLPKAHLLH